MTTFPPVVELEIDGTWVDVSGRLRRAEPVTIRRGRDDEASRTQPTTTTLVLDNEDGHLTHDNVMSPWWPYIGRGTPVRTSVAGGTPHMLLDGTGAAFASTPDHADLDITGDLWLAAEISLNDWHDFDGTGLSNVLIRKGTTAGADRSYQLTADGGALFLTWSTGGTVDITHGRFISLTSADGIMAVGAHLDVDNGLGGYTVSTYTAPSLDGPWTLIGATVTTAGTTSVFSGGAVVEVGPFAGRGYRAEIRSGDMTGTVATNPDFTAQSLGSSPFVDSTGKTWTFAGAATVEDRQTRAWGTADKLEWDWPLPQHRDSTLPAVAHVKVTGAGTIRRLNQGAKPLDSTLTRFLTSPSAADRVHAHWPCEDGRTAEIAASTTPGVNPGVVRMDLAADDTLDASAPLPHSTSTHGWAFPSPGTVPTTAWEVTWFVKIPTPAADPAVTNLNFVDADGSIRRWTITINDLQYVVKAYTINSSGNYVEVMSTATAVDSRMFDTWLIVVLLVEQSGANVNWDIHLVPIPLGVVFSNGTTINSQTCGKPTRIHTPTLSTSPPDGISFGHLIVSSGAVTGWLAGSDTAWVGETAAHRFYRLCREEQIPYAVIGDPTVSAFTRGDSALSTPMGPQRRRNLLDLLDECATVELGILSERRDGPGLAFRTRQSLYNQDPAVELDMASRGLVPPFAPVLDDQQRRNDITAKREQGSSARVVSDPAPAPGDLYNEEVDVNTRDDLQLPSQASWRVHLGTSTDLRYPALATSARRAGPAVRAAWAAADLGDMVEASNLMRQHAETTRVLLQGYTETFDLFDWSIEMVGSPAGPWTVGVLEDDVLGKLDTAGSVLDADFVAGTDTTMDVETTLGPLWTTDAGEFPFDLWVGGAQVTVTAIGAAVGQVQTFTVSATIGNGVAKTIPAGSTVRLWSPIVLAL